MYQEWMKKYDEIIKCAKNTSREDIFETLLELFKEDEYALDIQQCRILIHYLLAKIEEDD